MKASLIELPFALLSVSLLCLSCTEDDQIDMNQKIGSYHSDYYSQDFDIFAYEQNNDIVVEFGIHGKTDQDEIRLGIAGSISIDEFIIALRCLQTEYSSIMETTDTVTNICKFPDIFIEWKHNGTWFRSYKMHFDYKFRFEDDMLLAEYASTAYSPATFSAFAEFRFVLSSSQDFDFLITALDSAESIRDRLAHSNL